MAKIITMGELLLRLSTQNNKRFIQAEQFDACFGGSEANVAVSLSNMGYDATYVTKLPDNAIGKAAAATLKKYGVDTSAISYGGERIGIYYLEVGSSLRSSNVVYDRAGSSISKATADDFDFDKIFKDADWFHFSGITPALSEEAAILTLEAVKSAKRNGLTVSCDLNFRKKLWSKEEAQSVMPQYMEYVDICMGGREDAIKMLGFNLCERNDDDTPNPEAYEKMFAEMVEAYNFKYVICSARQSFTSSDNGLSGMIYDGSKLYKANYYRMTPMVDRVGGGDAFAAGAIAAIVDGKSPQDIIDFATAASVLKHTIPGDVNLVTKDEISTLIEGKGVGRLGR